LNRRRKKYKIDNEESFLKKYLDIFTKVGILASYIQKEIKKVVK
jgi:hypothetical protein